MSVPIPNQETPEACATAICAACGKEFGCAANACDTTPSECWCFNVHLSAAAIEEVKSRYEGCLCNECLVALAQDTDGVRTQR